MPMKDELNRLLILPNTEHIEITGIFEELPAAIAWVNFLIINKASLIGIWYNFFL